LPYLNHHEILCNHELTPVVRAHRISKSVIVLLVISNGEFGLHRREHTSSVFSRCEFVKGSGLFAWASQAADQAVRALPEVNKALREFRIAGNFQKSASGTPSPFLGNVPFYDDLSHRTGGEHYVLFRRRVLRTSATTYKSPAGT
jgi:hypothetical protein